MISDVVSELTAADDPLLITHGHADRDSLGSAIGLRALLGRGIVCTPDGVAVPAASLLDATGTDPVSDPRLADHDAVVVLDAPSTDRTGRLDPEAPILIDHHEPADLNDAASATLVDPEAGATAELVARLADDDRLALSPDAALPLLVGVLDDTGFLQRRGPDTAGTAADLFAALGDRADELPELLQDPNEGSEAAAMTAGLLRSSGYRAGDVVLATTEIGAHESAVAHELRDAGADVAVVFSDRIDELRVVARASDEIADRVNLATDLLPALADEFGGTAGGHAGSGAAKLDEATIDEAESAALDHLQQRLGVTFAPM